MSDGLNFVVVDEVEVESSHSRTSNRCSFDKLRAWPVGSDLDYCIRLRTPALRSAEPNDVRSPLRSKVAPIEVRALISTTVRGWQGQMRYWSLRRNEPWRRKW